MRQRGAIGWLKHDITHRGITAWALTVALGLFYLVLFFGDQYHWVPDVWEWVAAWMGLPGKWHFYGLLYTLAVAIGGVYVMFKYSHNRYHLVRTSVIIFVQATLAFAIPLFMAIAEQPEYYFSYLWPLEIGDFYPENIGQHPLPIIMWAIVGALVITPLLGIFYGKRWYCSWVCGCGGLANTAGEPFRHLSTKTTRSWKFEKWAVHLTLVLALLVTAAVLASWVVGGQHEQLNSAAESLRSLYGFAFVTMLSGIIGVVVYPIGGTRVWCRFFCPMAALLGLLQKFGRYRITVKDDMCISCGLCTKYCEMGIDVRAYAQANQDFVRAACVGCGICSEVCPRGVLRLENAAPRPFRKAIDEEWNEPDPQELTMSSLLSESYRDNNSRTGPL